MLEEKRRDFWIEFDDLCKELEKLNKELNNLINLNKLDNEEDKEYAKEIIKNIIKIIRTKKFFGNSSGLITKLYNLNKALKYLNNNVLVDLSRAVNLTQSGYTNSQFINLLHNQREYDKEVINIIRTKIKNLISYLKYERNALKHVLKKSSREFLLGVEGYINRDICRKISIFKESLNKIERKSLNEIKRESHVIKETDPFYKILYVSAGFFAIAVELITPTSGNPKIDDGKGKVRVLVSIFDRETPVDLDFLQVKKL
jgi:hypothetical protein